MLALLRNATKSIDELPDTGLHRFLLEQCTSNPGDTLHLPSTKAPSLSLAAMAQRWYIGKVETVDVSDDGDPRLSGRHVMQEGSRTALSEEKRMYQSEAKLHLVVQERFVLVDNASPQVCNVRSVDPELFYNEDKLGCARGVVWALVFEAAVIAAIAICWKLRFSMR